MNKVFIRVPHKHTVSSKYTRERPTYGNSALENESKIPAFFATGLAREKRISAPRWCASRFRSLSNKIRSWDHGPRKLTPAITQNWLKAIVLSLNVPVATVSHRSRVTGHGKVNIHQFGDWQRVDHSQALKFTRNICGYESNSCAFHFLQIGIAPLHTIQRNTLSLEYFAIFFFHRELQVTSKVGLNRVPVWLDSESSISLRVKYHWLRVRMMWKVQICTSHGVIRVWVMCEVETCTFYAVLHHIEIIWYLFDHIYFVALCCNVVSLWLHRNTFPLRHVALHNIYGRYDTSNPGFKDFTVGKYYRNYNSCW